MPRPEGSGGTPGDTRGRRRSVRRVYGRLAPSYDASWPTYLADTLAATLAALAPRAGERILDIGCGTGTLVRRLREGGADPVGIDLSPEMLAVGARGFGGGPPLVAGDAARLPFRSASFDGVASSSSLHCWPEADIVFREMARVLRPGGRLVLTDWCRDVPAFTPLRWYLQLADRTVEHVYSVRELTAALDRAPFQARSVQVYRSGRLWGLMTAFAERS